MGGTGMDVLIVTALKDELDAVLELEVEGVGREGWELKRDQYEFPFHVRELRNEHGEMLRVAAAWSGEMGETSAAMRAVRLIDELDPACLAMCGICAGRRKKVSLGDVIVADRVFSYDHGRLVAGREADEGGGFFNDITTYNLEATWKMEATYFAQEFQKSWKRALERPISKEAQTRWLLLALDAHEQQGALSPEKLSDRKARCPGWASLIPELREKGLLESTRGVLRLTEEGRARAADERLLDPDNEAREPDFRVHVGPIATGKTVREDPRLFQELERHVRKVLGVEMEATAIQFVAEQLNRRSIIAKAVSDHADHDKDDTFRAFACHASASFLVSFLRRYVHPREPGTRLARKERQRRSTGLDDEEPVLRKDRRDDFLSRVERACALREPPGTRIERIEGSAPFDVYLEVSARDGSFSRVYPVGALDQPITREALDAFVQGPHARYRYYYSSVISTLVHVGHAAPPELARLAESKRVNLLSFEEFQGLLDFTEYLRQQTARLESDLIYPPAYYVEQRGRVSIGGQNSEAVEDILQTLRGVLGEPDRRFALVLGDFGTGKTFLLHELARRMGKEEGGALVPVLIEMRALQKQRSLKELVAQHFAGADVLRFELEKFLYMLKEGRIALLFDGFDELALRVTYDRALEHFDTLVDAAQGKAKIVVTSRTQHFLTDHQIKQELARRAESIQGYRLIKLERFSEQQIRHFLVKRLGGVDAADERMGLLRDVRDLLGLSENPRLLSFIIELDAEQLKAARDGAGEITSARLYALLIEKWLQGEHVRVNPKGAPKGLSLEQLRRGATQLALLMWGRTERTVGMDELPEDLLVAASQGEQALEVEKVRHQLGSGSLLVRDEEGRFSFVHQSVMEWLVAEMAAEQVRDRGESPALGQREMSDLMADFFIALAGREATRVWAEAKSASGEGDMAKRNALHVLSRLRQEDDRRGRVAELESVKNLERNDLRGQDLSKADLHHANLRRADLSGVPLVEANLEKAQLQEACLVRAILDRARLAGADLTGADLMGASLMGADLRGVRLNGTSLRRARLLGALVDSFEGSDVFGAALPVQGQPVPQFAMESACLVTAFSPRDGLLATGHEDGTLLVWSAVVGKPLRVLQGHSAEVLDVVFSPDGSLLASTSVDGSVRLWSLEEGRCLHRMKGHAGSVFGLAFSLDGSLLASAAEDETVRVWSVSDGQSSRVLGGRAEDVLDLVFSPEGAFISTVSSGGQVSRWSVSTGERRETFQLPQEGGLRAAAFSPNREWLAFSVLDDEDISLWSMALERVVHVLAGHKGAVNDLAFSPDGTILASASSEGTLRLWDVSDGSASHVLNEADAFNCVRFSPDGTILASGSEYGPARLWSVTEGRSLRVLEQSASYPALRVAFSPDSTTLVCASDDGTLAFWDASGGRLVRTSELEASSIGKVAFSPELSRVATCNRKASLVKVWNVSDERSYRVSHPAAVTSLSFSPDGGTLVMGSNDGVVTIWSVETQRARIEAGGPDRGGIHGMSFSPDGTLLALACRDRVIRLWRMPEFTPGPILEGHGKSVRCVAFSPDGKLLASASSDRSICLWSIPSGKLQKLLPVGPESPGDVIELVFDPSGKFLVSLCSMGTALLWSVEEGRILRVLNEEHRLIQGTAFSPDGRTLAAAHDDGAVDFYKAETGERLGQLLRFSEGWVALRSDGRYRSGGETAGAFWYAQGLCRFEPQELSPYLSTPLQLDSAEPFLAPALEASSGTTAGHRQTGVPRESR